MKLNLIENSKVINPLTGVELNLGDKSIKQGTQYTLTLLYEGDYRNWTPVGEIKNDYYGKGGNLISSFSFVLPLRYDEETEKTTVICNIKASDTLRMPPTVYQGQQGVTLSTKTAYVYEIRLKHPTDIDRVIGLIEPSFVQVKPGVIKDG